MKHLNRFVVIVGWIVCSSLAAQKPLTCTNEPSASFKQSSDIIAAAFARTDPIELMSHNGVWGGHDNDLTLALNRDGTAVVTMYGYVISKTNAKYEIDEKGQISVTVDDKFYWVAMPVGTEEGVLVIRRPTLAVLRASFIKAGLDVSILTPEAIAESYEKWPLKQIFENSDDG